MSGFKVEHKSPEGLFASKAYSQAITVSGNAKTIFIYKMVATPELVSKHSRMSS